MLHLSIDREPEAVKQFFKLLKLQPEGSVVEMNGQPLARMMPAGNRDNSWSDAKSVRRSELIDREIEETITSDEALELELLQDELQQHVEKVAPLPMEYARQLHRE